MSQPTYNDMGKACKDFFSKGYYFGIFKLSVKNKTSTALESVATGTHNFEDQTATADFEAKRAFPAYGLTTTGKWNTTNLLTTQLDLQDKLAKGLKLSLEAQYNIDTAIRLGKLGIQYKLDPATIDLGIAGGDEGNMLVNGSLVLGYKGFLAGYQASFDTVDSILKKNNIALCYMGSGWMFHTQMENAETISAAGHYKIKDNLETGVMASYTSGDDDKTRVGVGLKYAHSPCTSFKYKVDNTASVGVAIEYKLTQGAVLTLCSQIDASNISGGGHKVGFALEFGG